MAAHKITVTVGENSIQVAPESLFMTLADEVRWAGSNPKQFRIAFDGAGPFAERELSHARATGNQKPRIRGRFKYTVISEENPGLRLDPEVVVGDPPTGNP